ncbi:uncharacterized protein LOC126840684 [Adelges cooleyi]|uniref:uncharacterized protein LOC126840684 n=1 Tax=Adelges cooleyi TaxID=133065 RepID=UPI00217F2507|nr:uncharacterized protein LOC126840684 [Adelges cooleyi]
MTTVLCLTACVLRLVFAAGASSSGMTEEGQPLPAEHDVFAVCQFTVKESCSSDMAVLSALKDVPDGFMARANAALNTTWSITDRTDIRPTSRAVLVVAEGVDQVIWLLENAPNVWDPLAYYVWLMPAADATEARRLFRLAWVQQSVINAVLLARRAVYTYNPFAKTLSQYGTVDLDVLQKDARGKTTDLHGYPVRVCMFPTRLKAVKQPDGTYKGTDGLILSALAQHMNFTPVISEPGDGKKYGWMEANNTFTGALADIVYNNADVAFNGVFLRDYGANGIIEHSTAVQFDELCFVVPKARQMSQWRAVFTAFDAQLWCLVAGTYGLALAAWTLIKRTTRTPYSAVELAVNLFQVFLMVPLHKVPNNIPERLMIVSAVLFGFITSSSLQAVMVKYLSYPKYERDVTTMQELYDTGLPVLSASTNLMELFQTDDNPLHAKMSERFIIVVNKSLDILGEVVSKKSSAAIGRKNDLVEKIAGYVKNNEALLYIVDECPRSFHIAYLIRRQAAYRPAIDRMITKFVESGIVNSWFMHAKAFQPILEYHQRMDTQKVFTMDNVIIAFHCLLVGLTASAIAFVVERVYFYRVNGSASAVVKSITTTAGRYPRRSLRSKKF